MPNSKNIAYTSAHLGFHMDLLYTANPPGYQLLHVLKNSCQGGESRFADSFYAAGRLKREDVRVYRRLCRWPVEWQYENDGQYYVQHRHTFEEVSHFVGANEAARRRIDRKQKQSALGDSDTAGEGRDADADLAYVNYSPPFQGRLVGHKPQHPERTSQFIQAIRRFDRILNSEDMVFELKMEEGTCAVFENRRVVHARNAFSVQEGDGGERWLKGAYVDEEAFWSTMVREGVEMEPDMEGVPEVKEGVVRTYGAPARPPAKWRRVWFDSKESG